MHEMVAVACMSRTTRRVWAVMAMALRSVSGMASSSSPKQVHSTTSISTTMMHHTLSPRVCHETLDPCVVLMKELIAKYSHRWEAHGGIYSLAQGVVYWKPPEQAYQRIQEALVASDSTLHQYCPDEGLPELRQALVAKIYEENNLSDHQVMVTAGANQAYVNCILTLMGESQKCVIFRPYYFNHVMAVQMTFGEQALVLGPCNDEGVPDVEWLRSTLESDDPDNNINVVTLVNPGNPTGVTLNRSVVQEIVNLCAKHGAWLILDCTYEHFDHTQQFGSGKFQCFPQDHVIHIFSLSKGHAMAGFRCGYICISQASERGRNAFTQMVKVQDTIPICAPRISQVAALGALSAGRSWVYEQVATLQVGRRAILEALSPLDTIMGGTGAMYVMGKLPKGALDDQEAARLLVEKHGVAVIPGSYCGFPGWIRVCYSNLPPDECEIAAERLAGGIRELCASSSTTEQS